jgi:predicted DNA-binding protein
MEVHLTPDLEARLNQLSAETGRAKEDLVQDAMAGYLAELLQLRHALDSRYDDIQSGRVPPVDGEEAFARLRQKKTDYRRD